VKKQKLLAILLSLAVMSSGMASDLTPPGGMLYFSVPLDAGSTAGAAHVGFTLGGMPVPMVEFAPSRSAQRVRILGFASMDPFEASDFNWWVIGGLAAAVVLIASRKSNRQDEQKACLATTPPPPGC
jgi:hypothetical protein